jgi:hypothetical protein
MGIQHNSTDNHDGLHDDSDADAFAVLSLLVIIAASIVYYISN